MIKKVLGIALCSSLLAVTGVQAADAPEGEAPVETKEKKEVNPFSDCGLGAAIFKNDALAAISNVVWDLGITAITSGLSSPETCSKHSTDTAQFIMTTYPTLAEETAKGEGENLTAMLKTAGCGAATHDGIIEGLRADYAVSLSEDGYEAKSRVQKSESFYNMIVENSAGQCSLG